LKKTLRGVETGADPAADAGGCLEKRNRLRGGNAFFLRQPPPYLATVESEVSSKKKNLKGEKGKGHRAFTVKKERGKVLSLKKKIRPRKGQPWRRRNRKVICVKTAFER